LDAAKGWVGRNQVNIAYFGDSAPPSTIEAAMAMIGNPSRVGVDVETISLADRTPLGFSIASRIGESFYLPLYPEPSIPARIIIDRIIRNPSVTKVYQNFLGFDSEALRDYSPDSTNIHDTLVKAILCGLTSTPSEYADSDDEGELNEWTSNDLTTLAAFTNCPIHFPTAKNLMQAQNVKTMDQLPQEKVAEMCCQHAQATIHIDNALEGKVNEAYYNSEMELIPTLIKMSNRGILLDQAIRADVQAELEEEVEYFKQLCEPFGFNPGSPQQVGYILGTRNNFLPTKYNWKTKKRSYTTNKFALKKCDDPLAAIVLKYRATQKLLGTYIRPWDMSTRAYTHFHMEAGTGRVSSTRRNLQNIPKGRCRNMFLPDTGMFTDIDYEQIELRVLAYLSQDAMMLAAFREGIDIHQMTSDFLHVPRDLGKKMNFAVVYGATPETVAEQASVSLPMAADLIRNWFENYDGAARWITDRQIEAKSTGRVHSLMGRTYYLPTNESPDALARKGVNYPVQGSAAEILKCAIRRCAKLNMVLIVHDEILFDGDIMLPDGLDQLSPVLTPFKMSQMERWN